MTSSYVRVLRTGDDRALGPAGAARS
jgi:hypothetical protein